MKTAVETIFVGRERAYNRRFLQMCSHDLVDPVACTPASGWEKGQVGLVRERFFIRIARKLKALDVIDVLLDLFSLRSVSDHIPSDNGPEFIAKAVRDWIAAVGSQTACIEPGSPWGKRLLRELQREAAG